MAQCVEKLAVKSDNLSSKLRIHMVERESQFSSCSLTSTYMYNTHVCIHTIYKQRHMYKITQNPKTKM